MNLHRCGLKTARKWIDVFSRMISKLSVVYVSNSNYVHDLYIANFLKDFLE